MDLLLAKKAYSVYLRLFDAEESIDEYFLHYMKIFWEDLETLISANDIANPKIQANIYFFKLYYSFLLRISKSIQKSTDFENLYTISIISYLISFEDKIRNKLAENHENFPHLMNHIQLIGKKYQQFSLPSFAAMLDREFHHENEYQKLKEEFFKLIGVNTQEKSNNNNNNNNQFVEYMSDYFSILLIDVLNENEISSYPPSTPFDEIFSKILSPKIPFIDSIIDCDEKLSNFPLVVTHLIDLIYRLVNNEKIGEIQHKWIENYSILITQSSMPYYITLPYILQLNPKLNAKSNNQIEIYLSKISLNSSFIVQKILNLCFKFEKPFLASSFAHKFANQLQEKGKFAESIFWYAKEIQILVDYKIAAVKQIRDFSDMLIKRIESDHFIDGASEILGDLNYIIEVLSSFQLFDEVDLEFLRQYNQYLAGDKMKLYEIMEKMTAPKKFWIPILSRISDQKDYTLTPNQIKITLARLEELFLVHTKIARNNNKEISRLRKIFSEVLSTSLLSN